MSYTDIRDTILVPAVAPEHALGNNDAGVCAVLRWAKRTTDTDLVDVADVCAELGLDLSGAIERARDGR